MAVLAEAISVVVKISSIQQRLNGGWDTFERIVPNSTLCADNEIARVGFMHPDDARQFVQELEALGLVYLLDGMARDIAVVDQQRGLMIDCDWIDFGTVSFGGGQTPVVKGCRLKGSILRELITPEGWNFEGSLSQTFGFVRTSSGKAEIRNSPDGIDEMQSPLSAKPLYVGRPYRSRS